MRNIKLSLAEFHKTVSRLYEKHGAQMEEEHDVGQEEKKEYVADKEQQIPRWSEDDTDISDAEDLKEDEAEQKVDRPIQKVDRLSFPEDKPTNVQASELRMGPLKRSYPQKREALIRAKAVVAMAKRKHIFLRCLGHINVYEGEPRKRIVRVYNCMLKCTIGSIANTNFLLVAEYRVNIMSARIAEDLGVITTSNVIFVLDDGSISFPEGRLVNVPVQFRGKKIKTNFLVYKFDEEPICPVILGQPFMSTQGTAADDADDQHTCVDKSPSA